MKRTETEFQTGKLMTLLLFVLLAVCVVLVLFTGAKVYERLTKRGGEAFENRTVPLYIATKIRQADCVGGIFTESEDGMDVLCLKEQIDGKTYVTRIYCYEGVVRELFSVAEVPFYPASGEKIAEASEICFSAEENCLKIRVIQKDGCATEQVLTLRSFAGEVAYGE